MFLVLVPTYTLAVMLAGTVAFWLILADWPGASLGDLLVDMAEVVVEPEWWVWAGGLALIAVGLQAVFLIPMFGQRPPQGARSTPLVVSLTIGALVAALLVAGLALGVTDVLALMAPEAFDVDDKHPALWLFVLLVFVGGWGFWSFCLLVFTTGVWADRLLGRMVAWLLAGTALELLVILPIDVMVRRKTDCYCAVGTFFSLCIAAAAGLWLAGPGVAIAVLGRKHRRWRQTMCGRCGYPKGPSPGAVCPECGFNWQAGKRPAGGSSPGNEKGD